MDIEHNSSQDFQEQEFQIVGSNAPTTQQQIYFDNIISMLQEIVICQQFEKKIQTFMKENWNQLEDADQTKQQALFQKFSSEITSYLNQKLSWHNPQFNMQTFLCLLTDRKSQVDEQLLDTLESLIDVKCFNSFMRDCKISHDEVQTYKVLTIKSNKIPENKTVKGKDNIFGPSTMTNPLFDGKMKKLSKPTAKQGVQKMIEKTQDQLLVPDLVLTVKGIRKG